MNCSPPGSCLHGILQLRILERVAILFSRGSSQPRDQTQVSCTSGRFFTSWATRAALESGCWVLNEDVRKGKDDQKLEWRIQAELRAMEDRPSLDGGAPAGLEPAVFQNCLLPISPFWELGYQMSPCAHPPSLYWVYWGRGLLSFTGPEMERHCA